METGFVLCGKMQRTVRVLMFFFKIQNHRAHIGKLDKLTTTEIESVKTVIMETYVE